MPPNPTNETSSNGLSAGAHAPVAKVQVDGRVVDVRAVDQRRAQALLLKHGAGALCVAQTNVN